MSKLTSLIKRAPRRFSAVVAMIAAAIIVPVAVFAYGPERPVFTGDSPAPYVTFNSIKDNPDVGDERNFVRIRPSGEGNYRENADLQAGKTYDVMVYYHNNAKTSLNASGAGIARNVMLRMQMESTVAANSKTNVSGFISASNANPTEVYDSASLTNTSAGAMDLSFVAGSAKVTSNGAVNGATLPDSVFSTGTKLGFESLDGNLKGCNEFAGYVIFKVKANQPNFTVTKEVRKTGETTWSKSKAVKAGDEIEYLVGYTNTGTTAQNNVVLKDTLPKGVTYKAGTTTIIDAKNPKGLLLDAKSDNATTSGINIGSFTAGSNAYIKFTAKVDENDKLPVCGDNSLVNKAEIQTQNGTKSDTATVTVKKECKPVVKYTCDSLSIKALSRTEFQFTTKYTAENATFKSVSYTIKDASGKVVDTKTSNGTTLNYTQTTAGKYSVQATVTFTVDGQTKTVTSEGCKGEFEVPKTPKDIVVCELATKKTVTIKESEFDASKYSKNYDDCKTVPPVTPPVTPPTPPELPHTGAGDNIVALIGLGALVASVTYYVTSRRALGL